MAIAMLTHKVVSTLPGVLEKNSIYYVRVGAGFDIYVTNDTGTVVAYPLNLPSGSGGGVTAKVFTVDFGANWESIARTIVSDASITPTSKIIAFLAGIGNGRAVDELEMNTISCICTPTTGSMSVIAKAEEMAWGEYKFNYITL